MPRRSQQISGVPFHYNGVTVEMNGVSPQKEPQTPDTADFVRNNNTDTAPDTADFVPLNTDDADAVNPETKNTAVGFTDAKAESSAPPLYAYDTEQVTGDGIPLLYKRAPLEAMPDGYDCRGKLRRGNLRSGNSDRGETRTFIPDFGRRVGFGTAENAGTSADTYGITSMPGISPIPDNSSMPDNTAEIARRPSDRPPQERNGILEHLTANLGTEELILAALLILMLGERREDGHDRADDDLMLLIAFLLLSGR